jgi:hypothetical protein
MNIDRFNEKQVEAILKHIGYGYYSDTQRGELCPHCLAENTLSAEFKLYRCSGCGRALYPCNHCAQGKLSEHGLDCGLCPLEIGSKRKEYKVVYENRETGIDEPIGVCYSLQEAEHLLFQCIEGDGGDTDDRYFIME